MAQVSAGVRADDGEGVDNNERYEISLGRDCIRANGPISRQTTPIWVTGRVRRVGVFDFGTGRVGYLQKSSGTGTGRDG